MGIGWMPKSKLPDNFDIYLRQRVKFPILGLVLTVLLIWSVFKFTSLVYNAGYKQGLALEKIR